MSHQPTDLGGDQLLWGTTVAATQWPAGYTRNTWPAGPVTDNIRTHRYRWHISGKFKWHLLLSVYHKYIMQHHSIVHNIPRNRFRQFCRKMCHTVIDYRFLFYWRLLSGDSELYLEEPSSQLLNEWRVLSPITKLAPFVTSTTVIKTCQKYFSSVEQTEKLHLCSFLYQMWLLVSMFSSIFNFLPPEFHQYVFA